MADHNISIANCIEQAVKTADELKYNFDRINRMDGYTDEYKHQKRLEMEQSMAAKVAELTEQGLGIMSSAVSFSAAFAAGFIATRSCTASRLFISLTTATALIIFLLTVGFLIKGEEMNASAILSIVSFTYVGVLSGSILPPRKRNGKKYHSAKLT